MCWICDDISERCASCDPAWESRLISAVHTVLPVNPVDAPSYSQLESQEPLPRATPQGPPEPVPDPPKGRRELVKTGM